MVALRHISTCGYINAIRNYYKACSLLKVVNIEYDCDGDNDYDLSGFLLGLATSCAALDGFCIRHSPLHDGIAPAGNHIPVSISRLLRYATQRFYSTSFQSRRGCHRQIAKVWTVGDSFRDGIANVEGTVVNLVDVSRTVLNWLRRRRLDNIHRPISAIQERVVSRRDRVLLALTV